MLAPGESLTGHLAGSTRPGGAGGRGRPARRPDMPGDRRRPPRAPRPGRRPRRRRRARRPGPVPGTGAQPGAERRALVDTVQRSGRDRPRLADGRGLAAQSALIADRRRARRDCSGLATTPTGTDDRRRRGAGRPAAPAAASSPTQEHADRGVTVNVPKGWKRHGGRAVCVDYIDPETASARCASWSRRSKADPGELPAGAPRTACRTGRRNCPKPYSQVGLRDGRASAARTAAELEYTCGTGATSAARRLGRGGQRRQGVLAST